MMTRVESEPPIPSAEHELQEFQPSPNDDVRFWVAFNRVPGIGRVRYQALQAKFGRLADAWNASRSDLKAAGLPEGVVRAIVSVRASIDPATELERLHRAGVRALTWDDRAYPRRLRETDDPPPVLYMKGELRDTDEFAVAVVGTRRPTPYGRQVAEEMAHQLTGHGITVISGLARGVDAIAHRTALESSGRTIGVLACGLDLVYPPEHKKLADQISENGALVSDYPLGTQPRGDYFPRRNRILAGMSLGVLVVEGDLKSGALITARIAVEQNREVFAAPGSIFSPQSRGPNTIIGRGEAKLVLSIEDVLEELNLTMVPQQMEMQELVPATDTEAGILQHLSTEPVHVDEVCRQSGLPVSTVSSLLAMMELKGLVRQMAPMAYVKAREARAPYGG